MDRVCDSAARRGRKGWVRAGIAATSTLLIAALAVATNRATELFPDTWSWLELAWLWWGLVVGLTSMLAALAVWQVRSAVTPTIPAALALSEPPAVPAMPVSRPASEPTRPEHDRRLWNIPAPVRSFINRDAELDDLADHLTSRTPDTSVRTFVLHGMGGVGKTQLARAYAQRQFDHYMLGWWISASTLSTIEANLAELAIGLGASMEISTEQLVAKLPTLLADRSDWLLIFDNSTEPSELERFLPSVGGGHILITSRNTAWGGVAQPMSVDLMTKDAAMRLLMVRTGEDDEESAAALADELGYLSLAMEQAAAYCAEYHLPMSRYLALFRVRRSDLLKRGRPLAYQGTVDTVFSLLIEELERAVPAAVQLLRLCALLDTDRIPVSDLLDHPEHLAEPLRAAATDPVVGNDAIGALYRSSLMISDLDRTARMHRLVRDVVLDHLPPADLPELIGSAVELIAARFPATPGDVATRTACARLVPHADALFAHTTDQEISTPALATLLDRVGYYLLTWTTDMKQALRHQQRALGIRRREHPGDHPDTAVCLNGLATTMRHMGRLERSRMLHEEALAMHRRVHPGDHAETAITLTDLSFTCSRMGDGEAAYDYGDRALSMRRRLYPYDHPAVIVSLNDLGVALRRIGEPARALELHEQALAMAERLELGDHPETGQSLYELGVTIRGIGDPERAYTFAEQALRMRRRIYTGDHRRTARSLHDLATTALRLGEVRRAREYCIEALQMRQRLHPGDHPETAQSLTELGVIEAEFGDEGTATELRQQAADMRQRLLLRERRHDRTSDESEPDD